MQTQLQYRQVNPVNFSYSPVRRGIKVSVMVNLRTVLLYCVSAFQAVVCYCRDSGGRIVCIALRISHILRNTQYAQCMAKLLLLSVLLSGCGIYTAPSLVPDHYYLNPDKDLAAVGRVAIIGLDNDSTYPKIAADVTEALFQALQKRQLFGLSIVRQSAPAWRSLQLDLSSTYTLEQLFAVRKTLKCDAVLIGTITGYKPYPHMAIGLRLKIIDLKDGQLLWALEQVWDSADKTTESQIKKYFRSRLRSGFDPLGEQLVAVSPLEFFKFVACEVAKTL